MFFRRVSVIIVIRAVDFRKGVEKVKRVMQINL